MFSAIVISILVMFSVSAQVNQPLQVSNANTTQRHLGWWIDERSLSCCGGTQIDYTPQQFFDSYFLTPPYPSAMLFATGINDSTWPDAERISWFNELASIADKYPAISINILIFVNISNVQLTSSCQSDPYDQSSQLQRFLLGIEGHRSVYGISYEPEYFGNTLSENSMFACWVNQAGYTFIADPSMATNFPNNPVLSYCEFPWFQSVGDSMESCAYDNGNTPSAQQIGIGFGEFTNMVNFPASNPMNANPNLPAGCINDSSGAVSCDPSLAINGWDKEVVQSIVDDSLKPNLTPSSRQYVYFYSGGVGKYGQNATWSSTNNDGQMMRDWVWNDSFYKSNFVLSNLSYTNTSAVDIISSQMNLTNSSQETSHMTESNQTLSNSSDSRSTSIAQTTNDSSTSRTRSTTPSLLLASIVIPLVVVCIVIGFQFLKKTKRTIP